MPKKRKTENKTPLTGLSARVEEQIKEVLSQEGPLRGHTLSEAVDNALKLGTPLYLKRFPKKFERVNA